MAARIFAVKNANGLRQAHHLVTICTLQINSKWKNGVTAIKLSIRAAIKSRASDCTSGLPCKGYYRSTLGDPGTGCYPWLANYISQAYVLSLCVSKQIWLPDKVLNVKYKVQGGPLPCFSAQTVSPFIYTSTLLYCAHMMWLVVTANIWFGLGGNPPLIPSTSSSCATAPHAQYSLHITHYDQYTTATCLCTLEVKKGGGVESTYVDSISIKPTHIKSFVYQNIFAMKL